MAVIPVALRFFMDAAGWGRLLWLLYLAAVLLVNPPGRETLKPYARGIRLNMLALIAYRSYHGTTTVWAFVVAILIVLVAGWYIRRRRQPRHPQIGFRGSGRPLGLHAHP
ncbi:LPXTG cell wall anchor domain-containing protein [Streptomyces sp. NPDC005236]|uniref:LPXTG cell wall anchor domain-containing protein n=1 Tax=Streptomyces sp. NPDC005236 TaxID=3157028 RepID=UPI0033AA98ED